MEPETDSHKREKEVFRFGGGTQIENDRESDKLMVLLVEYLTPKVFT